MIPEDIKTKFENIEDPNLKEAIEFVLPKFEELQNTLMTEKPSMLKMFKIARTFTSDLEKEYKAKYNRNLNDDMKKINETMGYSQLDMLNAFKNMGI